MQTYYGKEKQKEMAFFKNQIIIEILIVFSITFFKTYFI